MKTIAIATLGCKVNQYESAAFASAFAQQGCQLVPFSTPADVCVINTCTVTARAGQQSRQLIRRAIKEHPQARIIVTGCFAQMAPETVLNLTEHPLIIIGNGNKHRLVETALAEQHSDLVMLMGQIRLKKEVCDLPVRHFSGRTRALLRIQDGCDNFCSYCIVPFTRGRSRSVAIGQVLEQAAVFAEEGYLEMVVTGINVGKYGLDLTEGYTIYSLLDRLCAEFPGLRIRLSSIEPTEVGDQLLAIMTNRANFMPHLHIPLQSGDNDVLVRMNRSYTREQFTQSIQMVHQAVPQAAIGCDVLAGFPGETEAEAANTYQLLADLPVSYLHVFPYSKRPGTLAASFSHHLDGPTKEARVERLRRLDADKRNAFYQGNCHRTHTVLVERRHKKSGLLQGFSENYIPLLFPGPSSLIRTNTLVRLSRIECGQPYGCLADELLEEKRRNR